MTGGYLVDEQVSLLRLLRRNGYLMTGSRETGDLWIAAVFAGRQHALIACDTAGALGQLYAGRRELCVAANQAVGGLERLPYFNRAAVALIMVQGFDLDTAAVILQLPAAAVADLLRCGKAALWTHQAGKVPLECDVEP